MKIIFWEIKKIWNIKILALMFILSIMYYQLLISFNVEYFANGHPDKEIFDYGAQLTQKYGPTLEENEYQEFIKTREDLVAQANEYIKNDPTFASIGVYNYKDFENIDYQYATDNQIEIHSLLFDEKYNYIGFKIQTVNEIKENYENQHEYYQLHISRSERTREAGRLQEIINSKSYLSIMPYVVIDNYSDYTSWFIVLIILNLLILLSPLLVQDRIRQMHLLQYTAKRGRKILVSQFCAVMISAFLLITLQIIAAISLYDPLGTQIFLHNNLTSFISYTDYWSDITYGQLIIINILMTYTLGLGIAGITFALSKWSNHYVSLILKLIPVFILLAILCKALFDHCFSMINILSYISGVVGIEGILCVLIFLLGLAFCIWVIKREKQCDI